MSNNGRMEIAIGIFVVAGVIVTAGMVLFFGSGTSIFRETYEVKVDFPHIGGLIRGAPVKLGGVQIGRVGDIRLQDDGTVRVTTEIFRNVDLRTDATARIDTSGLVGDTLVEYKLGRGSKMLPKDGTAVIDGEGQISTAEILQQVDSIGQKVTGLVDNVNDVIGDPDFKNDIRSTVADTAKTAENAEKLFVDLRATSKNVFAASEDVRDTTAAVKTMALDIQEALNHSLTSPETLAAVRETVSNVRITSQKSVSLVERLDAFVAETQDFFKKKQPRIDEGLNNMVAVTADMRRIVGSVRTDEGLLKYFHGDTINKHIDTVLDDVRTVSRHMSRMVTRTSKLEWVKAWVGARQMWSRLERDLLEMDIREVEEIEDAIYRREQKKLQRRDEMEVAPDLEPTDADASGTEEPDPADAMGM
jgi:ABC-type transporter Mla subunit MlaD